MSEEANDDDYSDFPGHEKTTRVSNRQVPADPPLDQDGHKIAHERPDESSYSSDSPEHEHNDLDRAANSESSEDEDEFNILNRYWPPPVKESLTLTGSQTSKTLSAFTINNSGTRFAAGGFDHQVQIWDFEAIDWMRPESICSSQASGQAIVKQLDYSQDDERLLVIPANCQAVIMSKDGLVDKSQCVKGDQYLSDMANTKGHVNMLNDGCWHPKDKTTFITCSQDSTIRIWDLQKLSQQKTVIKAKSPTSGLKAIPNVCKFSRDALTIVSGCSDGTILMWDTRRKFISTSACIRNAHLKGSDIIGIDFAYGSNKICTRSEDESCKVWDMRQLKQPLASKTGLQSIHQSDCVFSPDDNFVLVGTSNTKDEPGKAIFLDSESLSVKSCIDVPGTSVVRVRWHPKINHIGFSCSNGKLHVHYDKKKSLGGLQTLELSASWSQLKKRKLASQRERVSSSSRITRIITPHSLPLFKDDNTNPSFKKIRQDPRRSYKPEVPASGASEGGQVKPAGSTLSSYIAKNIAKPVDDGGLNIRDRILRHADEAERQPLWIKVPEKKNQAVNQNEPDQR